MHFAGEKASDSASCELGARDWSEPKPSPDSALRPPVNPSLRAWLSRSVLFRQASAESRPDC